MNTTLTPPQQQCVAARLAVLAAEHRDSKDHDCDGPPE